MFICSRLHISFKVITSKPKIAAIDPSGADSISKPLFLTKSSASKNPIELDATKAVYSPSECPAIIKGCRDEISLKFRKCK